MATASVTNTFVNATSADADEVNVNFSDVVNFLNDSVVHTDGSKALASNQVVTASITDDAVTTAKIADQTDWTAFTPSWTNVSGFTSNGGRYRYVGGDLHVRVTATNPSTISSSVAYFTLPDSATSKSGLAGESVGSANYRQGSPSTGRGPMACWVGSNSSDCYVYLLEGDPPTANSQIEVYVIVEVQ